MSISLPRLLLASCLVFAANISSAQAPKKLAAPQGVSGPIISATETAAFPNHGDAYARQGDVITYTATISNTGTSNATGTQFTNPTPANTTDVAGSLNATPVAIDDTYPQTVQANMTVNTATSGFTVVTNDYPGILAGNPVALSALTISSFDGASLNGGIVTMTTSGANVGRFTYAAPPGFTGTDTFNYTISNGVAGTPAGSATGKVTITVSGPVIWFVDDFAPAGGNGTWTGTNSKAFQTVAQAAAVDAANHRIYLASGNYVNGIALNLGEWLIGQGATNSPTNTFDALMGISPGTDTPARPSIGGTRPALLSTVTLETNARVQGINLSTGTSTGMNDPAGAITGVTVSEVTVLTTTGTAVLLSSTGGTFSFTNISSNGAANGISLTSTTGSFTVTGNGGTCTVATPTCTGGRIQNTTGADNTSSGVGVYLNSAQLVSLTRMRIDNHPNFAIQGTSVVGLTLDSLVMDGTNGNNAAFEEGVIGLRELTGTTGAGTASSITNCFLGGGREFIIDLRNFNGGTLDRLTVSNNTFGTLHTTDGDDAAHFEGFGTGATFKVTFNNNTVTQARGDMVNFNVGSGGNTITSDFVMRNNTLNNTHPQILSGGGGSTITMGGGATVTSTYDISCNKITGSKGFGLLVAKTLGAGTAQGTIFNNQFGILGNAGSASTEASGLDVDTRGGGTHTVLIKKNVVNNWGANGAIQLFNNQGSAVMNVTVVGNESHQPSANGLAGLYAEAGALAGDTSVMNLLVGGSGTARNDFTDGDPFNGSDVLLSRINCSGNCNSTALNLSKGVSASNTPSQIITDNNITPVVTATAGVISPVNTTPVLPPAIDETCVPPLLFALGGVDAGKPVSGPKTSANVQPTHPKTNLPAEASFAVKVQPTQGCDRAELSQPELDRVVAAALSRWSATGLNDDQLATLRRLKFGVADLADLRLGEADGHHIRVDKNAGGNGWFIDATTKSDAQFGKVVNTTRRYTDPASAPAGSIDLLTAVIHEMGHALGLNDSYFEKDRDNVMYGYLTKGERRLPAKNQAAGAKPSVDGANHFLASPVIIGTLPAGKSVKITFQNTIAAAVTTITSQGTVSGSNFSNVLTDDPGVGGTADPTVVQVAIPPTSFSAASPPDGQKNVAYAGYTFIANGNPAPTYTMQSGTFPPGLNLSAAGALSGTPTTSGLFSNLVVRATNVAGSLDTSIFDIAINDPPAFTSANNTTFTVGTNGSFQLTASGFPTAMTFTNTGNSLPSGVSLSSGGLLSGTPGPGTGGSYTLTFQASNGIPPDATQSFTLTVNQAPAITSANNTTFTVGTLGSFNVTATGFPAPTFSETGALPGGVTLSSAGLLSGTPNADTDGTYPITMKASNGVGSDATQPFTLTVNPVTCTPPPANMVSWWPGNGNASDLVGGHDGTLAGGATANATGEVDKAFQFQGGAEVVNVPNSTVYDFGANPFTIDTWVKFNSVSGSDVLVAHDEGTGFVNKWIFWLKSGNLAIHLNGPAVGGAVDFGVPFSPTTGVWYHVAVTRSGSTYKFYVNGAQIGTDQTNASAVPAANASLTLGKAEALPSLNGFLDEVEIFNRALGGPELSLIYYAGRFGKCSPPLQLSSAVSRKTHAAAGTFDVPLPLIGAPGIECRDSSGNHTIVFTFTNAVVSGSASVTTQSGGSVSGSPTFAGKTMSVNLTGITNAQKITVKVSGVTDAVGQVLPDKTVDVIVLAGDTTASKLVNSTDVTQTKLQVGAPVNGVVGAANFREDVVVDGSINSTDVSSVKLRVGTGVP